MMSGFVSASGDIVVEIQVSNRTNPALSERVDAVLDTGFSEYLTLPSNIVSRLELSHQGDRILELADGSESRLPLYSAAVSWHGQRRGITVIETPSDALIGMRLLWGSRLIADIADGGDAVILPLERSCAWGRAAGGCGGANGCGYSVAETLVVAPSPLDCARAPPNLAAGALRWARA